MSHLVQICQLVTNWYQNISFLVHQNMNISIIFKGSLESTKVESGIMSLWSNKSAGIDYLHAECFTYMYDKHILPNATNESCPWLDQYIITQIAPLSFQGSHRTQTQTSDVRWLHASVVTEWSPACLHKQFPGDLHRGNKRKHQMEDVHNLINIGPTNPIQILNQHEIFWRFCMCNSNDTFDKNKKYWSRYWSSAAKTGSLVGIKQT